MKWLLVGRSRDRFPVVSLDFSVTYSLRPHRGLGIDSASSENEYQKHFLGVKAAGAWGWRPYHLQVLNVVKIWEPKLPGTLWATPGLLRDCFTFLLWNGLAIVIFFGWCSASSKWACSQFYLVHTFLCTCRFSSTNFLAFLFGHHILLSLQTTYPLCHSQTCFHHVVYRCLFWSHIKTLLQYNIHSLQTETIRIFGYFTSCHGNHHGVSYYRLSIYKCGRWKSEWCLYRNAGRYQAWIKKELLLTWIKYFHMDHKTSGVLCVV